MLLPHLDDDDIEMPKGTHGIPVIIIGSEFSNPSWKSWMRLFAFHITRISQGKGWIKLFSFHSPFCWGSCRIHQLHLCSGVRRPSLNECPGYNNKPSDSEAPALEIWGMRSTPSLPLLPGPLWSGVVTPDRVLSMGWANKWLMLNCDCYRAILETI